MLLAVQEPAFSELTSSTYCPRGFKLVYEANPATRVCFMVSDQLGTDQWMSRSYGPNVASITIRTTEGPLSVVNVYNPRGNGPRIQTWGQIATALDGIEGEVILLGDFNAHHPTWGGTHVASEPQSEHLLRETERRGLHLLTPRGEATWRRGAQDSVIDLTFATDGLQQSVTRCGPMDGWAIALDHIPIDIRLSRACHPRPPSRRYAIRKLDRAGLEERIKLSGWETDQDPLSKIKIVVKEALDQCCPRAKPHEKANHRWSPRAAELLVGARRARRAYLSTLQAHHYQAMRSFQNLLKKELRRGGRSAWRRFIQEITTSKQLPHNKVSGECPDGASRHQARAQPTCRPYGVTTRSK